MFATSPGGTLMGNRNEPPHQLSARLCGGAETGCRRHQPARQHADHGGGDATFSGNLMIDSCGNRDFLNAAVNWLCDRPLLVAGIGPRPVTNFHLQITRQQQRQLTGCSSARCPGRARFRLAGLARAQKMKSKSTSLWFLLAAALAAAIWILDHLFPARGHRGQTLVRRFARQPGDQPPGHSRRRARNQRHPHQPCLAVGKTPPLSRPSRRH